MSFDRCWTNSCLNIREGCNKRYVKDEVQQGTVVAYLIKSDDLNIEEPLGRVNVKPFYSLKNSEEVLYSVDNRVYGNVPNEQLFKEKIKDYLKEKQEVKQFGFYRKVDGLYSDAGSPSTALVKKRNGVLLPLGEYDNHSEIYDDDGYNRYGKNSDGLTLKEVEIYLKYKDVLTSEQLKFLIKSVEGTWEIDQDGYINVEGAVSFAYNGISSIPVKFGKVSQDFDCYSCNLTSLEGSPKEVGGSFDCGWNGLTNLIGGPLKVGGSYNCRHNNLSSLEGSPKEIVGDFYSPNNSLTNLIGGPLKVGGSYTCSTNPLISLEGAPQEVGGMFMCSYTKLSNLKGVPSKLFGLICSYSSLISLEGTPQEIGEGGFDCSNNDITSLIGGPQIIDGVFDCRYNLLTNLDGFPKIIKGMMIVNYQKPINGERRIFTGDEINNATKNME
jgi:hypothetical protein